MIKRDDLPLSIQSADTCLRFSSAASRRCRGIPAETEPRLVYLLGCYRTWMAAGAFIDGRDARSVVSGFRQAWERSGNLLMETLRRYAADMPAVPKSAPDADDANGDLEAAFELEVMPLEEWMSSSRYVEGTDDSITDATSGLTPAQVYSNLACVSDSVSGYWLLGRLESLIGLQSALLLSETVTRDRTTQLTLLRNAITLQSNSVRESLQLRIDKMNESCPALHATCESLFVEGLAEPIARLIVVDSRWSLHA